MNNDSHEWVMVGRFTTPAEAMFYKNVLEGYGIPAWVENEYMGTLYAPMFGPPGCLFLKTPSDRYEEARLLLEDPQRFRQNECIEGADDEEPSGVMILGSTLRVSELFVSIQGESTWAGMPCGFIRLTGCNLRCRWCDTDYAYKNGVEMSLQEIMEKVKTWSVSVIEITGGEPLLQPGCASLAETLLAHGYTVLVETNGTQPIDALPGDVIRIMDIKCPDSGMSEHLHWPNLAMLKEQDEIKFVLASRADYEWACEMIRQHELDSLCAAVLFSPALGILEPQHLAEWILQDLPPVRMHLQMHKYIWPLNSRGV